MPRLRERLTREAGEARGEVGHRASPDQAHGILDHTPVAARVQLHQVGENRGVGPPKCVRHARAALVCLLEERPGPGGVAAPHLYGREATEREPLPARIADLRAEAFTLGTEIGDPCWEGLALRGLAS